jgi:hypothetical protein
MSKPVALTTEEFVKRTNEKLSALGSRPIASRALKATIDPLWTAGLPTVQIDGEDFIRSAGYPWDPGVTGSWTPVPGQRVYVVPENPDGWIIAGPIAESRALMNTLKLAPYRSSNWVDYDATYHEWYFSRSTAEITLLGGLAKTNTAVAAGDTLFTLPEGFEPIWDAAERVRFPANNSDNASAIDVWGDGHVTAAIAMGINTYLSLQGVMFPNVNSSAIYTPIGASGAGTDAEFTNGWVPHADTSYSAPGYWLDPFGVTHWKGMTTNPASLPGINTAMVNLNNAALQSTQGGVYLTAGHNGGLGIVGYCDITPFTFISFRNGTSWTASGQLSLGGLYGQTSASDTYFFTPSSIAGGWTNYGGSYVRFGQGIRPDGIAMMRGLMKGGTVGSAFATSIGGGAWMAPGAASMRPRGFNGGATVNGLLQNRPSNDARGRLDIRSDGNEVPQTASPAWFSVDGVFWVPEW